jgi:hypothetical protein
MTLNVEQQSDFHSCLAASTRSPEIPESADVYGWLCGSWDLDVLCYRGVNVAERGLRGEVHAARVLKDAPYRMSGSCRVVRIVALIRTGR